MDSIKAHPGKLYPYDVTQQPHYTQFAIQPIEYIAANKLDFFEGCAIKYITRWKQKDGVKDLKKAIRNIQMLINEIERGNPLEDEISVDKISGK